MKMRIVLISAILSFCLMPFIGHRYLTQAVGRSITAPEARPVKQVTSVTISPLSSILKGNSSEVVITVAGEAGLRAQVTLHTKGGTSGEARFVDDDSTSKEVGVGTTTLRIKGVVVSSEVDNLFIEASTSSVTKQEYFTVVVLNLVKVGYSGPGYHEVYNGQFPYQAPHWLNGAGAGLPGFFKKPVAYTRNARVQVSAELWTAPRALLEGTAVKIRGNGMAVIPETTATVSGITAIVNFVNAAEPLSATVDYLSNFHITWEATSDMEWMQVGTSSNPLYITLAAPPGELTLDQALLDIGCRAAKGAADETAALDRIWAEFADRTVTRRFYNDRQEVILELQMTYYMSYLTNVTDGRRLLLLLDGQCGSWADLLGYTLRAVGVKKAIQYVFLRSAVSSSIPGFIGAGFFVKNWSFTEQSPPSPIPDFPYMNLTNRGDNKTQISYIWQRQDASDLTGIPGQGVNNPASIFVNHQFLKIDDKYYDASYGVIYTGLEDCLTKAVDALYAKALQPLNETEYDLDLNGDGDKVDTGEPTFVYYLKRYPSSSSFYFEPHTFQEITGVP
jgi:hypothetical protein